MDIHVLLAVDAKQVIGCAVSMRSLLVNARPGTVAHFHVLTNGLGGRDRAALAESVRRDGLPSTIVFHEVDVSRFAHLMASKLVSHTTYSRLLLGDVLGPELGRCIYIDCDMVIERDIVEAWECDLQGRTVAAVANGSPSDNRDNQRRLGLAEPRYFNAGFVVTDLRRWHDLDVGRRAMAFAESVGDRLVLHDQDALNGALQGDWVELPREWNAGLSISDWLTADAKAVFHYWGAPKPWHADYAGRFHELFLRHLDGTAFAGRRPWNPLGLGAALARARRRLPHLPAVARAIRQAIGRAT